jgi:DNA-binding IclR family transcriptional regulator
MPASEGAPYIVQSVVHAYQVLKAFQSSGEALRLRDVVERTRLGKGLCFRLLHTLHHIGMVEKVDATRYRLTSEIGRRRRHRIGYAAQGQSTSFPREVLPGSSARPIARTSS